MSVSSLFRAAPEMAMAWGGFSSSAADKQEPGVDHAFVQCPETFYKGQCCLTCASAAEEAFVSGEDRPTSIHHAEEIVKCADGASLRYQLWDAEHSPPRQNRGVVLVLHDFSSRSDRACRHIVPHLLSAGFSVATYDLRGHGRSSDRPEYNAQHSSIRRLFSVSRRIVVDGDDCWLQMQRWRNDVEIITRRVGGDEDNAPMFLLGDGFGAAMAIEFAVSSGLDTLAELGIRGIAASGAILGLPNDTSFEELYEKLDANGSTKVRPEDFFLRPKTFEDLSRDLRIGEMAKKDALPLKEVNALVLKAAVRVIEKASKTVMDCPVPLAFFHGKADSSAPLRFVENIVHQADTRDISLHVYPKAKHWLHHEVLPERTDYLHDLVDWLVTQSEETNSCHQIV